VASEVAAIADTVVGTATTCGCAIVTWAVQMFGCVGSTGAQLVPAEECSSSAVTRDPQASSEPPLWSKVR